MMSNYVTVVPFSYISLTCLLLNIFLSNDFLGRSFANKIGYSLQVRTTCSSISRGISIQSGEGRPTLAEKAQHSCPQLVHSAYQQLSCPYQRTSLARLPCPS